MKTWIPLVQIIVGIFLSGAILMQAKGTGLGRSFGGTAYHARRGMERVLFKATMIMAVFFVIISILNQFLP